MKLLNTRLFRWSARSLLCAVALALFVISASAQQTALDRYVAKLDPAYSWKLVNAIAGQGFKGFVIELTSQQWRTEKDVDRPVWKHWLTVVKPDNATTGKALLFIGGGNNNSPAPTAIPERVTRFALESNSVVAELGQGPKSTALLHRLERQRPLRGRPDRLHARQAFLDERRRMAGAAGDGQKRREGDGRHSGIPGERRRGQIQS